MSTQNTHQPPSGGPAYPTNQYANGISPSGHSQGMTLRDYFAAQAMQGLCAHGNVNPEQMARAAYIVANAMLEARK